MADLMRGNNAVGVAVVYLSDNWQLSLGEQLPSSDSDNDYGMVFEITNYDKNP